MESARTLTAFIGRRLIVSGSLENVLLRTKERIDGGAIDRILIFEDGTGTQVDFDFRGTPEEVLARAAPPRHQPRPGRPKLGVVCREVSLLPRHWDWLEGQPNGISAALRRLVDEARRRDPGAEEARVARDAAYKVMTAMAGDLPGFEEASRALFGKDQDRFEEILRDWPEDVRTHLTRLTREAIRREGEGVSPGPLTAQN